MATTAAGFQPVPSNTQDHNGGYVAEQQPTGGYQVPAGGAVNPAIQVPGGGGVNPPMQVPAPGVNPNTPTFTAQPVQNYATAAGTPQMQNMYWATPRPQNFYQSYPIPAFSPENSRSSHQYEPRCAPPPTHPPQMDPNQMSNPTYDQQMNNNPQMNNNYNHPPVYQPVSYPAAPPGTPAQPQLVYTPIVPQPQKPPMTSGKAQAGVPVSTNSPFRETTVARVLLRNCGPDNMAFPQLYYNQQLLDNGKPVAGTAAQGTWCQHTMTPTHARPPTPTQPPKNPFPTGDPEQPPPQSQMVYHVVPGGIMVVSTPSPSPAIPQPELKNTGEASGARSPEHWADRSNCGASTESNVSHVTNETSDAPMEVPPTSSPSNASTIPASTEKESVRSVAVSPGFGAQYDGKASKPPIPGKVTVAPPKPLHPPPLNGPAMSMGRPAGPAKGPSSGRTQPERPPLRIPAPLATYTNPTSNLKVYAPQDMAYKPVEENIVPSNYTPVTTTPALSSMSMVPSEGRTTPGSPYKTNEPIQDTQEIKPTNMDRGRPPNHNFPHVPLPPSTVVARPDPRVKEKVEEISESAKKSTEPARTANDEHLAHLLAPLLQPPKEEPWQVKRKRKRRKPKTDSKKAIEFESEESRGSSMTSSKPNSPKKLSGPEAAEAEAKRAARTARNQRKKLRRRQKRRSKEQKSNDASASPEPNENESLVGTKKKSEARQSACAWLQTAVCRLLSPIIPMSLAKEDVKTQ